MSDEAIRQAAIFVGGKGRGSAKSPATRRNPCCRSPMAARFSSLLEAVERHGYEDILLLAGYLADKVEAIYQGRRVGEARVRVLREPTPLGTAGALTLARDQLEDRFLMLNGDALFDVNLRALECKARVRARSRRSRCALSRRRPLRPRNRPRWPRRRISREGFCTAQGQA